MRDTPFRDPSWWFGVALTLMALAALVAALQWEAMAATFPVFICSVMIICGVIHTILPFMKASPVASWEGPPVGPVLRCGLWMGAFFAAAIAFGFPVAAPVFVLAYMLVHGEKWTLAVPAAVGTLLFLVVLVERVLRLPLPEPWFPLY